MQPTPRKRLVWEAVQERRGLGQSRRQIAQALGVDRRTVRRDVAMAQTPVSPVRRPRPTQWTPPWNNLAERWAHGGPHARRRFGELEPRGDRGFTGMVRVVVRPGRTRQEGGPPALRAAQVSRRLLPPAGRLTAGARGTREAFLRVTPPLAQGTRADPLSGSPRRARSASAGAMAAGGGDLGSWRRSRPSPGAFARITRPSTPR